MNAWHDQRDGQWLESRAAGQSALRRAMAAAPEGNGREVPARPGLFRRHAAFRSAQTGLEAVAHYYDRGAEAARPSVVLYRQASSSRPSAALVVEMSSAASSTDIRHEPWQTDTCIGNWHYDRPLYERNGYKSAKQVVQRLADVVSKNGNLLLSIPVRGDGTIDDKEEAIVDAIARVDRAQRRGDLRHSAVAALRRGPDPAADRAYGGGRGEAVHRRGHALHTKGRRRFTRSSSNGRERESGDLRRSACERRPMRRSNAWNCSAGRSFVPPRWRGAAAYASAAAAGRVRARAADQRTRARLSACGSFAACRRR